MTLTTIRTRWWIALVSAILLGGLAFPPHGAAALANDKLQRAMLATTKIFVVNAGLDVLASCSGTYQGQGIVLTNFHCVGHTELYGPDALDPTLQHGELYHPEGWVAIAPQRDPKQLPRPTYFARYVAGSPDQDMAVVKIFRMIDPNAALPAALPIPAMVLSDSDRVQVNDPIYMVGYPAAGGDLITLSQGHVAGFDEFEFQPDGVPDVIKTDFAVNHGNSGGLAMNDAGEQVGIPTFFRNSGEGIGGVRMINLAVPYVQQARTVGDTPPGLNTPQPGTSGPTPGPGTPLTDTFGSVLFGTAVENGKLQNIATQFVTGTQQIIGVFPYKNMRNGMLWGWRWEVGDQVVVDHPTGELWDGGPTGVTGVQVNNPDGLASGTWRLTLFVNSRPVQTGNFVIGTPGATQVPTPPGTGAPDGVLLQGQIVDADTGAGLPSAALVILQPGVSVGDFDNADKVDPLIAAVGLSDQDGYYITAPPLARGQHYTVLVGKAGYARRAFEAGLELTADDPDLVHLEPLALQKP